jgi:hypothetical protein
MLKRKIENWRTKTLMKASQSSIEKQLLKISEWFIYPEFRKKFGYRDLLKRSKYLILAGLLFLIYNISIIFITYSVSHSEKVTQIEKLESKLEVAKDTIQNLEKGIQNKEVVLAGLIEQTSSRDYLEFVIKRDCHLRNPQNLSKLSDEVFFTIIEEIEKYKIPYTVFFRLIDFESGFTFITNTSSGAFGYCQVLPSTFTIFAQKIGLKEHNEVNNIKIGASVLKWAFDSHKRAGHDDKTAWFKALVNYSGGSEELAMKEMQYYKDDFIIKKAEDTKRI